MPMQPLSSNDPDQIGPYRVFAELGRGAMGRVLLGAGPDGRPVAVKVVREWLAEEEEFRARFREEVRKSRKVSGQYTAAVVKAGPNDPVPWLASEFLRGPTLGAAIETAGPLPEDAVLRLAAGLASALDSIHDADVIHRDLKPGNVILAVDGPRVIDFGIARAADGGSSDLTRTGAVIGTPGFMSPEQALSEPVTAASDVFSLGAVLVMACTGDSPFATSSTLRTLNNVVRAQPDLTGVPARVRALAARCMALDPDDRPTPAELLELIGPVAPRSNPWPEAVAALADEQHRELARLLDNAGEAPTLIDDGPTLITDPSRPTWVGPPAPPRSAPPVDDQAAPPRVVPPIGKRPSTPPERQNRPSAPPVNRFSPPPPNPPPAGSRPDAGAAGMAVFLILCAIAVILVIRENVKDDEDPDDTGDMHETYVQDCQDAGYSQAACETSWSTDSSYVWTGYLYDGSTETTGLDETTESEEDQYEVYIDECQGDGYSQSACEESWYADASYTWTGELHEGSTDAETTDPYESQKEAYLEECQSFGYTQSECETSWLADPSYTWTGELFS
ncbi:MULTISPECIES: serine/threonine-protein kinase [Glycomyces]|uniref:non-specific serine/threonine protein kinase n=2 Tax=Glycomyces TaxID=58113 RepID=A0A9X3SV00_9ACTN|nr:serine/threonine-protein kinase [Glycomyces lechevalierae]MDA1384182.1 serine/threonine-protein kinase [Glycomyces lechevalierae]MDR7339388.1 serine/threonine protein kinase [Glycomyces lechevalierae]